MSHIKGVAFVFFVMVVFSLTWEPTDAKPSVSETMIAALCTYIAWAVTEILKTLRRED